MRRRHIATFALPLLLLVACDARREFPPGFTDVGLWQGPQIRVHTEVPDQYPNGTTREAHLVDPIDGEGDDGAH